MKKFVIYLHVNQKSNDDDDEEDSLYVLFGGVQNLYWIKTKVWAEPLTFVKIANKPNVKYWFFGSLGT